MKPDTRLRARSLTKVVARLTLCATAAMGIHGLAQAQAAGAPACGELGAGYGPFDYRVVRGHALEIVEKAHFTQRIEMLVKGERVLGDDLSYTLHVFPNHHRALIAMTKLSEREKTSKPEKSSYTVECWFDRAVRFRPDDTVVRVLFAQFLSKQSRKDQAIQQLEAATQQAADNAFSHYNIGLMYFEIKEFDRALVQAHKAQALGFTRHELADRLKRENRWREPGG